MTDGSATMRPSRRRIVVGVLRLTLICGGLVALYAVLPYQDEHWKFGALIGIAAIVAIVPVTIRRVNDITHSPYPAMATIESLVMIVSMLVLGFSGLYLTLDRNGTQFNGLETRTDAVYFTVTTLSTVGFGDINAAGQSARVMVTVQILLNFTLFAFAIKTVTGTAAGRLGFHSPGQRIRRDPGPESDGDVIAGLEGEVIGELEGEPDL